MVANIHPAARQWLLQIWDYIGNPQDGRRRLYHLAPAIPVTKTERGWEMDFGYCLVRYLAIKS